MPNHIYTVPCLRTIHDQELKLYSLIDLIDTAKIDNGNDLFIPPFKIFSKWRKSVAKNESEKFYIKIICSKGDGVGKEITIDEAEVELPEKSIGMNMVIDVGPLPIENDGEFIFTVKWKSAIKDKWKFAANFPISVKIEKDGSYSKQ